MSGRLAEHSSSNSVALFDQMYEHYDITKEKVPYRLETFFSILEWAFGYTGSRTLSRAIARKLYASLSIPIQETAAKQLTDYVEDAKDTGKQKIIRQNTKRSGWNQVANTNCRDSRRKVTVFESDGEVTELVGSISSP